MDHISGQRKKENTMATEQEEKGRFFTAEEVAQNTRGLIKLPLSTKFGGFFDSHN